MGEEQATPSVSGLHGGEGGAGGKLRRPASRRPPRTPYDRPPANQSQTPIHGRDGGWLSKFVDPAYRLIAGGATKILPSFFSKSPSVADDLATEYDENGGAEVRDNADDDVERCTSNLGVLESTGGIDYNEGADPLNGSSDFGQPRQDKLINLTTSSEFSKIEQMVKGRTFSRDEINRLTEILKSQMAGVSNVETEAREPNADTKIDGDRNVLIREISGISTDVKENDLNKSRAGMSTPLLESAVKEVGASPVDIARAYMGSRVSEVGNGFKKIISKDKEVLLPNYKFAPESLIASSSPRSTMCWPGAMVHNQHGYSTPQSGRHGFHYGSRTPYSRTIYSKSKTKLNHSQAEKTGYLSIVSTPRMQPQTPSYGQGTVLNDGHGSVGPIRHMRRKFLSEARPPRGSASFHISQNGPLWAENSKGFSPSVRKNFEAGAASTSTQIESVDTTTNSSEVVISALQTPNPAARAILEHLERNKPTPKEKSAELRLATAWKKSSSAKAPDAIFNEGKSLLHTVGFDFHKNTDYAEKDSSHQGNDRVNTNIEVDAKEKGTDEATDMNKDIEASAVNGNVRQTKWMNETASFEFTDNRKKGTTEFWPFPNQFKGQSVANSTLDSTGLEPLKKPMFQPSATKPILAAISVDRPGLRPSFLSDNSIGFTFPVSASSSVLPEPPTPSIMPSTMPSGPQPKDSHAIPSYSFGTSKSTPRLVFSFPSTSTAAAQDGRENPKFNFGSDKKNRISFGSVGKDAICY